MCGLSELKTSVKLLLSPGNLSISSILVGGLDGGHILESKEMSTSIISRGLIEKFAGLREGTLIIRSNFAFQKYFCFHYDLEGMLFLKILNACKK